MSSIEPMEYNSRLKEIVAVLRKHSITKGVTPLKLREIGAVAVTAEKSKDLLDEMVEKGELTVEQGKVLNEELKHNVKKTVKEKVNALKPASAEELSDLLDKMTPEQIAALKEQILKKEEASETAPDEA